MNSKYNDVNIKKKKKVYFCQTPIKLKQYNATFFGNANECPKGLK